MKNNTAENRCRTIAQILIEAIGADGPENAEDTAKRAVARIDEILMKDRIKTSEINLLVKENKDLRKEVDRMNKKLIELWEKTLEVY